LDGEIHFNENNMEYDQNRTAELERLGIKVIRVTNQEVYENMPVVLKKISETLKNIE